MRNDNHYDFNIQFRYFSHHPLAFWVIKMETLIVVLTKIC
jgi:hypothetical protein